MSLLVLGSGSSGYQIQRSVRLRSSATAYFNKAAPATSTNQIWTFSTWVKRGALTGTYDIFSAASAANAYDLLYFYSGDNLIFQEVSGGSTVFQLITTQVFRDPSAWYHIVLAYDSTQATASNRIKLYVNGNQITSFTTATYPALNGTTYIGWTGATTNTIGRFAGSAAEYFDGYMAEINFVSGQQLTPSSFGQYNSVTGVWQPKAYAGTYGTNGFFLKFTDNSAATAAAIGKDYSGNGNNWTPNNISVTAGVTYDSMTDVPTLTNPTVANYPTLNYIATQSYGTITNGNLNFVSGVVNQWRAAATTMFLPSGKFYFEATIQVLGANNFLMIGACGLQTNANMVANYPGSVSNGWSVQCNGTTGGTKYNNGASTNVTNATFANWLVNDVLQCAVDVTNGRIWFGKNNTWLEGVPSSGTGASYTNLTGPISPAVGCYSNTGAQLAVNFGQRPFTYTAPTGFESPLNAYNLPTPSIPNGAAQFAATLYTGNGVASANALSVTNTVNGTSLQPDFVWVKSRSLAQGHVLEDSVRGTSLFLQTNSTAADQATGGGDISSFNSNGFTISFANARTNQSAATYVAWQWKGSNASAVTNTSGSLTSQVSANTTAGFSVVTFTAQTSGIGTVGHGLNIAPSVVITKTRGAVGNWSMYHASLGNTITMFLNLTNAATVSAASWNNTSPTSSVFTLGSGYVSAGTILAYCFAEISGYSKFGSYSGNSSTDGQFVYTGFRPRFVMVKNTTVAGAGQSDWHIVDTARNPYNVSNLGIWADSAIAEYTATNELFDIVANGFKLRGSSNVSNASGSTYIYMAFAENPFQYALAR